jgi:hypothetical protein
MKTKFKNYGKALITLMMIFFIMGMSQSAWSQTNFKTYQGRVVDDENSNPLVFAMIGIEGTNISTVTNTEGNFTIKIPAENLQSTLKIAFLGYENVSIQVADLKTEKVNTIRMKQVTVSLAEISVFPNDPRFIIDKVMENRTKNYSTEPLQMTAFYRETIKKRRTYVGIAEAVVQVLKQPYNNSKSDQIKLAKGRKNADTEKMDTLLFKLQGGPYSTLMLDVAKDPYMILSEDVLDNYDYTFASITRIDGKLNYVIEFKQKPHVTEPLFYGKMYIDMDRFAISSITFNLNTENREEASQIFIKRKPAGVKVYPTNASYIVKYAEKDGKWYFNYSRGEVAFKVSWKKKLLSATYSTMVEMAVTDWGKADEKSFKPSDRMKMNVIMAEAVNGFNDENFWEDYNTIEPEQSIEAAIKKIRKKLDKMHE